jgi:ribosomal-protein-serine acetyltransferase
MIINEIQVNQSVTLKILKIGDANIIFEAMNNNRMFLRKWLPFVDATKTVSDTQAFVKSIVDDVERRQEVFTLWYNNEFAGLLGLKDIDYLNHKLEFGYWLIEKMCGKGIMSNAVEKLIGFCHDDLGMNRIQIKCAVGNNKSVAIPKRLGFTFEGIERAGEKHGSKYFDLEVYSLLKKEWI